MNRSLTLLVFLFVLSLTAPACKISRQNPHIGFGGAFPPAAESATRNEPQPNPTIPGTTVHVPAKRGSQNSHSISKGRQLIQSARSFQYIRPLISVSPKDSATKKTSRTRSGKPVERNAMYSFILALCGMLIIPLLPLIPALILGIIGIVKYQKNPENYDPSSNVYAIAGITISAIFLLLTAAYLIFLLILFATV